jgi:flagellar motor component MotA
MNYKGIDNILTNIINLESENDKKILMTIKKEGVLGIQQGLNPRELSLLLNSHVDFGIDEAIRNYTK